MILLLVSCSTAVFVFWNVEPFLAETRRVPADTLVVEGWVHEYAIRAAVDEFRSGAYRRVFTTGGPVVGGGGYVNDYQTSASVAASRLKKLDMPGGMVQMVPSHVFDRDRTYASAVALRNWLREHNLDVHGLNVITESAHARRTRLMFQEAFGKDTAVGVIAVANPDYNESYWWRYSDGVKEVSSEALAYLYARFLFAPGETRFPEDANRNSHAGG